MAKKPKLFYQKDGEEQDAHYSPNVVNKYLFNLFLNMFILVALLIIIIMNWELLCDGLAVQQSI